MMDFGCKMGEHEIAFDEALDLQTLGVGWPTAVADAFGGVAMLWSFNTL